MRRVARTIRHLYCKAFSKYNGTAVEQTFLFKLSIVDHAIDKFILVSESVFNVYIHSLLRQVHFTVCRYYNAIKFGPLS